jgi:hypothetical protein
MRCDERWRIPHERRGRRRGVRNVKNGECSDERDERDDVPIVPIVPIVPDRSATKNQHREKDVQSSVGTEACTRANDDQRNDRATGRPDNGQRTTEDGPTKDQDQDQERVGREGGPGMKEDDGTTGRRDDATTNVKGANQPNGAMSVLGMREERCEVYDIPVVQSSSRPVVQSVRAVRSVRSIPRKKANTEESVPSRERPVQRASRQRASRERPQSMHRVERRNDHRRDDAPIIEATTIDAGPKDNQKTESKTMVNQKHQHTNKHTTKTQTNTQTQKAKRQIISSHRDQKPPTTTSQPPPNPPNPLTAPRQPRHRTLPTHRPPAYRLYPPHPPSRRMW